MFIIDLPGVDPYLLVSSLGSKKFTVFLSVAA
jgi:hypothetical protein